MNITPEQIGAALAARVEEAFPGETVYQDITPRDIARPSNLVVLEKVELDPASFGLAAVELRFQWKLTTFAKVDEVHDSHLPELTARAMGPAGPVRPGVCEGGRPGAEGTLGHGGHRRL